MDDLVCQWRRSNPYLGQCTNGAREMTTLVPIPLCDYHHEKLITDVERRGFRRRADERAAAEKAAHAAEVEATFDRWDAERAAKHERSVVYYVQRSDGAIKIGYTSNLTSRLSAFSIVTPVVLLATMKGARKAERAMHRRFAADRLGGEWFQPSPELMAHVELLQQRAVMREAA